MAQTTAARIAELKTLIAEAEASQAKVPDDAGVAKALADLQAELAALESAANAESASTASTTTAAATAAPVATTAAPTAAPAATTAAPTAAPAAPAAAATAAAKPKANPLPKPTAQQAAKLSQSASGGPMSQRRLIEPSSVLVAGGALRVDGTTGPSHMSRLPPAARPTKN